MTGAEIATCWSPTPVVGVSVVAEAEDEIGNVLDDDMVGVMGAPLPAAIAVDMARRQSPVLDERTGGRDAAGAPVRRAGAAPGSLPATSGRHCDQL
jgi:hypothetical protein